MKQVVTKRLPGEKCNGIPHKYCAVIGTLKLFASKWKPCIICNLMEKPMRYNELYRTIANISRKMLSEHLHELISDQLIIRVPYDRKMQRVEYSITEKGRSLLTVFHELEKWGLSHIQGSSSIQEMIA
jgi:DNA-binding HxlR family transcriptional regulator